jgi:endonuclease YncB( thermonuclease family)
MRQDSGGGATAHAASGWAVMIVCTLLGATALAQTAPPGKVANDPDGPVAVPIEQRINRNFSVADATEAFASPSDTAPAVARLRAGVPVLVTGVVAGKHWLQVVLPDDVSVGYVHAEAVPELGKPPTTPAGGPTPPGGPAPPEPGPVTGLPIVRDTATLVIAGREIRLSGIEGTGGALADGLQQFISASGGQVACKPGDPGRYVCLLPNGLDLALAALVNGAARAEDGAPEAYRLQQAEARHAHRGIWVAEPPADGQPPLP